MTKRVFIAHPIAGNVQENCKAVVEICRAVHTSEILPFAPYLASLQYLDDTVKDERELGICLNKDVLSIVDELWLCGPRISLGMQQEIRYALELGIPIKCYNLGLQSELEKLLAAERPF